MFKKHKDPFLPLLNPPLSLDLFLHSLIKLLPLNFAEERGIIIRRYSESTQAKNKDMFQLLAQVTVGLARRLSIKNMYLGMLISQIVELLLKRKMQIFQSQVRSSSRIVCLQVKKPTRCSAIRKRTNSLQKEELVNHLMTPLLWTESLSAVTLQQTITSFLLKKFQWWMKSLRLTSNQIYKLISSILACHIVIKMW